VGICISRTAYGTAGRLRAKEGKAKKSYDHDICGFKYWMLSVLYLYIIRETH
jgi:hypothetical protein